MIGDQIKAATLLGAFVEHCAHPRDYGPLGVPELNVIIPATVRDPRLTIDPLPRDLSALIDDVAEDGISYDEDRELVCAAVADELKTKVDRFSYLLTELDISVGECSGGWFRVLPGRPLTSYVGCCRPLVEVATAQHLPGGWVPLSQAMPLSLVVQAAALLRGVHICARVRTLGEDDACVGGKNWGHDYHSWDALLASLWDDHRRPRVGI